jgi:hypothetical protein
MKEKTDIYKSDQVKASPFIPEMDRWIKVGGESNPF